MAESVDKYTDVIDSRDVIARLEELREQDERDEDEQAELTSLEAFMEELKDNGGDEQWNGDWYPVTIIRDSYFRDYAQELAEECCEIPADLKWPYTCIDWEQAARELQQDYTAVEFDGVTYWTR